MSVRIYIVYTGSTEWNIALDLEDSWLGSGTWQSPSETLGAKSGPFKYNKGLRQGILWDGAGTALLEINDLDMPPYHIDDGLKRGQCFYKLKDRPLRYGLHNWFHRKDNS